jgi:hypothetical protein
MNLNVVQSNSTSVPTQSPLPLSSTSVQKPIPAKPTAVEQIHPLAQYHDLDMYWANVLNSPTGLIDGNSGAEAVKPRKQLVLQKQLYWWF